VYFFLITNRGFNDLLLFMFKEVCDNYFCYSNCIIILDIKDDLKPYLTGIRKIITNFC